MKRYWIAILLVCVLAGLILCRAIPDSSIEPFATDIGEIQLQSSALASQQESSNVGSSIQESQTTTFFTSKAPATKPVETTPATKPATTKPPTTKPPATKPSTSTTTPTGTTDPNHTHKYTKEYVEGWAGGAAHYVYTCACGHSYQETYSCGVKGHICKSKSYHESLMEYIAEGCTHCGSSECPCLLAINASGYTWPDYTPCPHYDVHKDPSVYCQTCGLVSSGNADSGEKCCRKANKDITCSWCGKEMFAGECHQCTKP